jgi:hypothetical protein
MMLRDRLLQLRARDAPPSRSQLLLARIVVWTSILLVLVGMTAYGMSADVRLRVWHNLIDRPDGPMVFRFVLQPLMAAVAALRDGIADAASGRPPFFQAVVADAAGRRARLDEALVATARIMLLGLVMDAIYQVIEFRTFHPVEAVIVALLLAFVPYLVLRGPVARVARRWVGDAAPRGRG